MTILIVLFLIALTIAGILLNIAIITLYYSFIKRSKLYKRVAAELEKVTKERDAAVERLLK